MKNKRYINEFFENWGKENLKTPENNLTLKSEILSRVSETMPTFKKGRQLPWLSISFASIAVMVLLVSSTDSPQISVVTSREVPTDSIQKNPVSPEYYYPATTGSVPVKDNRQFLKTYYNATLKTRDTLSLGVKVEALIQRFDGRLDSSSNSEEYGHLSFVLPAQKLEAFRVEIKNLTGKKLVTEQLSSENLLPQKQSIEEQKKQVEKSLLDLKSEKTQLTSTHTKATNSYSLRINGINQEIELLQREWQTASYERKLQINTQLTQLQSEKNNLSVLLENENSKYRIKLTTLNNNIKNYENNLDYVNTQDQNLMDNVQTVNGTISLDKVNLWEISDIYTPGPLLIWLLVIASLASYYRYKFSPYRAI